MYKVVEYVMGEVPGDSYSCQTQTVIAQTDFKDVARLIKQTLEDKNTDIDIFHEIVDPEGEIM